MIPLLTGRIRSEIDEAEKEYSSKQKQVKMM